MHVNRPSENKNMKYNKIKDFKVILILEPTDYHCMDKWMKQNLFYCALQKNKRLEQHEGE